MGSSFNEIVFAKKNFKEVRVFKPLASRKNSKKLLLSVNFKIDALLILKESYIHDYGSY